MSELAAQVERVVREVLAEMGRNGSAAATVARKPGVSPGATGALPAQTGSNGQGGHAIVKTAKPATDKPNHNHAQLVVDKRLVTLADLDGRLASIRKLIVQPGAVVTPAVRDELDRRRITLTFGKPPDGDDSSRLRLVAIVHADCCGPSVLTSIAAGDGVEHEIQRQECIIAAIDALAVEIAKPGTLAVLATQHVAVGLCLANRQRGVRAIAGSEPSEIAGDAAAVGANLLVVDPRRVGPVRLRRIVQAFCRDGARPCPKAFAERIG